MEPKLMEEGATIVLVDVHTGANVCYLRLLACRRSRYNHGP